MMRKLLYVALAAGGIGAGFVLDALLFSSGHSNGQPATASTSSSASRPGFDQYRLMGLIIEVGLSEQAGDPRLIVAAFSNGKPVTQGLSVSGSLARPFAPPQSLRFVASGSSGAELVSSQAVGRPHVFDATLKASWKGQSASFVYARKDGLVKLSPQQVNAARIGLASAGPGEVVTTLQLPGEIRFNQDRTAHVGPRVGGVVERVPVSVGQRVTKGQLLAVIVSTDLADRRSELLTTERRLTAARVAYERERTLWLERISAEQDYLQAQVLLREAEIAARGARQKLEAIGAPPGGQALNRYELRAPFDGTIVERHVTPGEAIAADTNVFTLADLSTVWAEMAVNPQQLDAVRIGRAATVRAAAFDSSSTGRVSYVGELLGEETRSAVARVVLPNPDGVWRPGMFVNVAVEARRAGVSVAVAKDALQDVEGAASVFVQSDEGFVAQPVTVGRQDEHTVEVVSGLAPGQRYAAANSFVLKAELGKASAEE
ncbi:efflux RND transporter periplasmic adaptor subunit [Caballeronia sp. LZ035]|uniref:efflux RND transporter periplasmic adaptor subunit n=1 Tax=Caballeronia sp. LZ035 TaxID=3038568 RepID=UPI002858967A|nr:efflux RND transporter periplasmic adaptor subunit [Caballeronia sp. LZ035]MDR5761065.1 efflux RND transporter periplasmic adaptor subunit [Caballeronia sp. LZ035]